MAKRPIDAGTAARRWLANMRSQATIDKFTQNVNAVTESPTEKAAQRASAWLEALNRPETREKWVANLRAVSLSDWKRAMTDKALPRMRAVTDADANAWARKYSGFLPALTQILQDLDNNPATQRGDFARNMDRAREFARRVRDWWNANRQGAAGFGGGVGAGLPLQP